MLCAEGFKSLLLRAKMEGCIKGVSICRRAPSVTNLMFADDSILFCRATFREVEVINEVLRTYGKHQANVLIWKNLRYFLVAILKLIIELGLCLYLK